MPSDTSASSQAASAAADPAGAGVPPGPQPPHMISISELSAHPGNVREELDLTQEFCASIAEVGVRIPLLVTTVEGGGYLVIEGHRRLAAVILRR